MNNPKPKTKSGTGNTSSSRCPFCDFRENRSIKTGNLCRSILSNPRLMPGHTLVIPKRHVEKPWDLTKEELQEIYEEIGRIEQKMLESGLASGCDVRQNYRPFLVQSRTKVDHVHFHVLPRNFEDELYQKSMQHELGIFSVLQAPEQQQMKKLLK